MLDCEFMVTLDGEFLMSGDSTVLDALSTIDIVGTASVDRR